MKISSQAIHDSQTLMAHARIPWGSMLFEDSDQFFGHLCCGGGSSVPGCLDEWSWQVRQSFEKHLYATTFLVQPPHSMVWPLWELYVMRDPLPCQPVSPLHAIGTCPSLEGKMPEAMVASTSFRKFSAQHCFATCCLDSPILSCIFSKLYNHLLRCRYPEVQERCT